MTRCIGAALFVFGCGAAAPHAPTTGPRTIEVQEASVVQVERPGTSADGALPLLPVPLETTAAPFQQGFNLAHAVLAAPGPGAPPLDDQPTYDVWIKAELEPWLEARSKAVQAALAQLAQVIEGPPAERVVAAALVGLIYAQAHDQLLAVPPPPSVRADEKLLHIYRHQVNQTSASWVDSAVSALRHCASDAAAQREPVYGPWLELCQRGLARMAEQEAAARALAETVLKERDADAAPPAIGPVQGPEPPTGTSEGPSPP